MPNGWYSSPGREYWPIQARRVQQAARPHLLSAPVGYGRPQPEPRGDEYYAGPQAVTRELDSAA
jgi:hypothetical protein